MSDKAKSRLMIAGAALCAALFLFSGAMLAREYLDQKRSAEAFAEVADLVKEDVELPTLELADDPAQEPEGRTAYEKYAEVYAQNSDLVGWISIPGTRIDYPVMQTKDNPNFYLKHAFDKSYSSYGVPYMQENCDIGISDNLVIYGHHMNNGSMFSNLCKYENEDFYREHKTIRFDTLDSFGEYEVVAAFKTVAYSEEGFKYYHFVRAEQEEDFNEFIAKCKELALYDTGVTAEYGDQLITLSTCEYSRTNGGWLWWQSCWRNKGAPPWKGGEAMGKGIKIRVAEKGIKAIDKAAVASERMKEAYIRTRDKADHSLYAEESSPGEYASDRLSSGVDNVAHEAIHQSTSRAAKG